jgi:ABC-type transport system substrate-binding protein
VTTVPTLTIWIEQSNSKLGYNSARIGQLIKRDLKKIGIQCNIIEMSEKSIKNLLPYQGYDIIVAQQPFSRLLPLYRLYHNFACNSRNKPARSNYSSYCSQELSEAISNIQYAPLELDLSEEYNRIQELLLLSVPCIPIAYNSDTFIYNKDITTLKSLLVNGFDFSETKFREVE